MGPKQRKSLSSVSSQPYSDSPWKVLTRVELYQVLDQCDIPVSSEKLLKGELIELLESNLGEKDCRRWLEHYEKPLPSPNFGLTKTESGASSATRKERKSVPAYIAVANSNSDALGSVQDSPPNELCRGRALRRRNSMHASNAGERARGGSRSANKHTAFEPLDGPDSHTHSGGYATDESGIRHDKHFPGKNRRGSHMHAACNDELEIGADRWPTFAQDPILNIKSVLVHRNSKIATMITALLALVSLYNRYYYFFHEPNFCDSASLGDKFPTFTSCLKCPPNGHCKDGKLKCNAQYKRAIKYLNDKWQVVCVYDNEAFDLAEEMLIFIANRLRKLRGHHACSGNNLHDTFFANKNKKGNPPSFDRSVVLSEKEINDIIKLSFNYIEQHTVDTALSIMWNSIKSGNSLSRYRLKVVEPVSPDASPDTSVLQKHDSQASEKEIFVEALDSEASIMCEAKMFIQKWLVILGGILVTLLPPYFKITTRRRKASIMKKIKSIICRENRKDAATGLFVGPDSETILRLLRMELPKHKKILNEQLVKECCDCLEQNDPTIHKTLMSDSKHPFYWSSA